MAANESKKEKLLVVPSKIMSPFLVKAAVPTSSLVCRYIYREQKASFSCFGGYYREFILEGTPGSNIAQDNTLWVFYSAGGGGG